MYRLKSSQFYLIVCPGKNYAVEQAAHYQLLKRCFLHWPNFQVWAKATYVTVVDSALQAVSEQTPFLYFIA